MAQFHEDRLIEDAINIVQEIGQFQPPSPLLWLMRTAEQVA